jgi:rare lipoprotein A
MPTGTRPTMVASASPQPALPRNALAFRSTMPEPVEETSPEVPAAPVATAVPLPPERPFDLGTIPNAGTPVRVSNAAQAALPSSRPVVAGLYFASAELPQASLNRAQSFQRLQGQDIAGVKSRF